eukprot:2680770-Pleurochrysis_carterae.AAC.1
MQIEWDKVFEGEGAFVPRVQNAQVIACIVFCIQHKALQEEAAHKLTFHDFPLVDTTFSPHYTLRATQDTTYFDPGRLFDGDEVTVRAAITAFTPAKCAT